MKFQFYFKNTFILLTDHFLIVLGTDCDQNKEMLHQWDTVFAQLIRLHILSR